MRSDFLFAQPSYLSGLGRLLDFAGALDEYNTFPTGDEADAVALAMDWQIIAEDYRVAYQQFLERHPELAEMAAAS